MCRVPLPFVTRAAQDDSFQFLRSPSFRFYPGGPLRGGRPRQKVISLFERRERDRFNLAEFMHENIGGPTEARFYDVCERPSIAKDH